MNENKNAKSREMMDELNDDIFIALFRKSAFEYLERESETADQDPEHVISEACDKRILSLVKREVRKKGAIKALKSFSKVAAIILIIVLICTATIISVEAFRVPVFNLLFSHNQRETRITVSGEESSAVPEGMPEPSYIPIGYELTKTVDMPGIDSLTYLNSEDDEIYIARMGPGSEYTMDTENSQTGYIKINGYEGLYAIKNGRVLFTFRTADYAYFISAYIDLQEVLKIAESIQ